MAACEDEITTDSLIQELECPVCFELCVPPIYMCVNGHNVCPKCRDIVDHCSVCRAPGRPSIRNLAVEGISNILVKTECRNASSGCTAKFNMKRMEEHLLLCEYDYACRFDCRWNGRIADLQTHALEEHPSCFWECKGDEDVVMNLVHTHFCYCLTLFSAVGGLFWYMHEFDAVTKLFAVSVVQARLDGERGLGYWYSVEFESATKNKKCRVESTVEGDEETRNVVKISLANIVECYKSDKVIPFKFAIHFSDKSETGDE